MLGPGTNGIHSLQEILTQITKIQSIGSESGKNIVAIMLFPQRNRAGRYSTEGGTLQWIPENHSAPHPSAKVLAISNPVTPQILLEYGLSPCVDMAMGSGL